MADYSAPLRDIEFTLEHVADLAALARFEAFEHAEPALVRGVLDEAGRFMADVIGPLNRVGDVEGSTWEDGEVITPTGFKVAYDKYVEAGWGGVPFDPDYGGGGFPWLVATALQEMLTAACMSFSMAPLLTQGAIDMLAHHADETQREIFLPKMVTGEWTGSMNLTEPEAGSDVGALRTKAVPAGDGTWRITGTKIFITFGEHDLAENIIHLVLARTPDAPPGTKGISCFIVPKFLVNDDGTLGARNDVVCASVEHKMGIKASPTCVLNYGEQGDGAVGYLIGEENQGMRYMFTMMNNARLSVGLQGLALAERSYQDALAYAQERRQGRAVGAPPGESSFIIEHPDVRRMLLTMKASIEAMRGLIYVTAEAMDRAAHDPDEDDRESARELADLLIPIAKGWSTDLGVEVTSLAIQVHGGMGYIEETGVAQHFRDARIPPIYEGTNGIQGMDLVGRKLPMRGGGVMADFIADVRAHGDQLAVAGEALAAIRTNLHEATDALEVATQWLLTHGAEDPNHALAGATPYLRLFGLVAGGWVMARQALAAQARLDSGEGDPEFLRAKVATATFYAEQLLPEALGLVAPVTAGSAGLFAIEPKYL